MTRKGPAWGTRSPAPGHGRGSLILVAAGQGSLNGTAVWSVAGLDKVPGGLG